MDSSLAKKPIRGPIKSWDELQLWLVEQGKLKQQQVKLHGSDAKKSGKENPQSGEKKSGEKKSGEKKSGEKKSGEKKIKGGRKSRKRRKKRKTKRKRRKSRKTRVRKKSRRKGGNIATAMGCKEGQVLASGSRCPLTSRISARYMATGQCCINESSDSSFFGGKRKKRRRATRKRRKTRRKKR